MPIPFISLREILQKDLAHGGKTVLVTGKLESGKTGLLLGIAARLCDDELCIFRGMSWGQEFRFPGHLNIIAYKCDPKFYDVNGNQLNVKVKKVNTTYDDILKACELKKLNVLYFSFINEPSSWASFFTFLVQRFVATYESMYVSLFMDEIEDLIPSPEVGTIKYVREFLAAFKEFRKSYVSFYGATQQYFDIHWKLMGKINYRIYLRGAFVSNREGRVNQQTIDNLQVGRGIISGSYFGFFSYPNYPTTELIIVR